MLSKGYSIYAGTDDSYKGILKESMSTQEQIDTNLSWKDNLGKRQLWQFRQEISSVQKRETGKSNSAGARNELLWKRCLKILWKEFVTSAAVKDLTQWCRGFLLPQKKKKQTKDASQHPQPLPMLYILKKKQTMTLFPDQKFKWVITYCNDIIIMLLQPLILNFKCIW